MLQVGGSWAASRPSRHDGENADRALRFVGGGCYSLGPGYALMKGRTFLTPRTCF